MTAPRLAAFLFLIWLVTTTALFAYNLPTWCAHPEMDGYSTIQGFCPKE